MKKIAIGQTVTLVKYEPGPNNAPGKGVEYAATVLGVERVNNSDVPHLHLAFLHPGRVGVLTGADWRGVFDRLFAVPHEDDVLQQSFYYRDDFEELSRANDDLRDINAGLEMELAAEKLHREEPQAPAQDEPTGSAEGTGLPSADDLDAVAKEEKVKAATASKSK